MPHSEAVETLLANTEDAYGFPPFSIMERAITLRPRNLRKGKKRDITELRTAERAILEEFLGNMPVTRLISPNFGWADTIPDRVLSGDHAGSQLAVESGAAESNGGSLVAVKEEQHVD
jgi:hypothetical protein